MTRHAARLAVALVALVSACHPPRGRALVSVRDALVRGDIASATAAGDGVAACAEPSLRDPPDLRALAARSRASSCLQGLASGFGGDGAFLPEEDASLGALGIWLLRMHHGEWIGQDDRWLIAMAGSAGPGADSLRLAVAIAMAKEAGVVRRAAHDGAYERFVPGAVARAVPGACEVYAARPDDPLEAAPATPCVTHDLERLRDHGERESGGATQPTAQGALALWTAASRALDLGQDRMTGAARIALGRQMGIVRVATSELDEERAKNRSERARDAGGRPETGRVRP